MFLFEAWQRVQGFGLGLGVQGLRHAILGLSLGFRIEGSGLRVGLRVLCLKGYSQTSGKLIVGSVGHYEPKFWGPYSGHLTKSWVVCKKP